MKIVKSTLLLSYLAIVSMGCQTGTPPSGNCLVVGNTAAAQADCTSAKLNQSTCLAVTVNSSSNEPALTSICAFTEVAPTCEPNEQDQGTACTALATQGACDAQANFCDWNATTSKCLPISPWTTCQFLSLAQCLDTPGQCTWTGAACVSKSAETTCVRRANACNALDATDSVTCTNAGCTWDSGTQNCSVTQGVCEAGGFCTHNAGSSECTATSAALDEAACAASIDPAQPSKLDCDRSVIGSTKVCSFVVNNICELNDSGTVVNDACLLLSDADCASGALGGVNQDVCAVQTVTSL